MSNDDWKSQLSAVEKNTYSEWFSKVDADNKSIVLQDEAMSFFVKSGVGESILKEFWREIDKEGKGFLTEKDFCIILKWIACAQNGVMAADSVLTTKVSLPEFNTSDSYTGGNSPPPNIPPRQQPQPQQLQQPQQTPQQTQQTSFTNNTEAIPLDEKMESIKLFHSLGPVNNALSGENARSTFIKSNLPPATLLAIWNLADTRKTGNLTQTDFIIAMYYIKRFMSNTIDSLPSQLPPHIYASAAAGTTNLFLPKNNTLHINGPSLAPGPSPIFKGAALSHPTLDISPEEANKSATFFRMLDSDGNEFVEGSDAVTFFKHSKLPDDDLATIWDLADTNGDGKLNMSEFTIAMHLINRRIAGGDIPSIISPGSLQVVSQQQTGSQQPLFPPPPPQQQNVDLLGLSSDFTGTPISATFPQQQQQQQPQQPQQPQQTGFQQQPDLESLRSQSAQLQSNITAESQRAHTAQAQFTTESHLIHDLLSQIEQQKEMLEKMKHEAEEAEKQLETEKKRKEQLLQELKTYRQEGNDFVTRTEQAQQELKQVRSEIDSLEEKKKKNDGSHDFMPYAAASDGVAFPPAASPRLAQPSHHDFFTLSSTTANTSSQSHTPLFAKVNDLTTTPTSSTSSPITATSPTTGFDPFAGFKASQQQQQPIKSSLNTLKQENEAKKIPNVAEISDIESKFPDLNTMEKNFAATTGGGSASTTPRVDHATVTSPTLSTSSAPVNNNNGSGATSPSTMFKKTPTTPFIQQQQQQQQGGTLTGVKPKKFDFSMFDPPSTPIQSHSGVTGSGENVKDELSSLFGATPANQQPSTSNTNTNEFDNIFGTPK